MRLVDPTDDILDEAFVKVISHWEPTTQMIEAYRSWADCCGEDTSDEAIYGMAVRADRPRYSRSADVVLPWIEKSGWYLSVCHRDEWGEKGYKISIWENSEDGKQLADYHDDKSLARALTISLLRAHGVVIEFAKETV